MEDSENSEAEDEVEDAYDDDKEEDPFAGLQQRRRNVGGKNDKHGKKATGRYDHNTNNDDDE